MMNLMTKIYNETPAQIRHFILHFLTCIIHPSHIIWALLIEIGDEFKHRVDPDKHPKGFDQLDFFFRSIGGIFGILLRETLIAILKGIAS